MVFCSLIFLKMLKAHVDMVVRRQPLGFMSALCREPLVQPEALRWVFCFSRAELETDGGRAVCALPQCSAGCYGRLVSFLEGAKLHLLGELSFYQRERNTTLLAKHPKRSLRLEEQREVDECERKTSSLLCKKTEIKRVTISEFLVDSSCDLKYSYDLRRMCVNMEDLSLSGLSLSVLTFNNPPKQTQIRQKRKSSSLNDFVQFLYR